MRKISVFNFISLDGYYAGPGGDISWAKARQGDEQDQEENDFGRRGVGAGNIAGWSSSVTGPSKTNYLHQPITTSWMNTYY